jgi:elongation factor P
VLGSAPLGRFAPVRIFLKFRFSSFDGEIMKINGNAIRAGMIIEHQGRLWRAVKTQHTMPGKGGAFAQVELKDIRDGTKLNQRFRSSETAERVTLEQRDYTYLFTDGSTFTFMDMESYEQIELSADMIGEDQVPYLQENMTVTIESYEDSPISVQLPTTVVLEITEADAVVKGQTASSSYKPALLENGVRTSVPPHIASGTRVVINTDDGSYVERAKD